MKTFYEMIQILNKAKGISEVSDDYGAGDYYDDPDISFSKILGEGDDQADFSVEVDIENGHWEAKGSIWVLGYVPNGSENPASEPVAYTAGQKDSRGIVSRTTGTEFMKPGKHLDLLPVSIKAEAIAWVDREVKDAMNNYKPEDPRDYDDREPYNPDPDGHGYWDRYWSTGPGRDR